MNTLPLVLPELRSWLEQIPQMPLSTETLSAARQAMQDRATTATHSFPVTTRRHPIPETSIEALIVTPTNNRPTRALLHVHGGGYIAGLPEQSLPDLARMATELDCLIISPDYRLAPETPFPGGIEDCYATYLWMIDQVETLGINPTHIGLTGESAGGGAVAALALMARDRNAPKPLFQNMIYPMLDDRAPITRNPATGEFVWTAQKNTWAWTALLAPHTPGSTGVSPYAAPARCENLSNLPPAYISLGALDLFLEEDFRYAETLIRAGNSVELALHPGAYHAFDQVPDAPVAERAKAQRIAAMRRAFTEASA